MRPASIIFLVLSLILIITGSVICSRATREAEADGFNLLERETDEDGNSIRSYPLTKEKEDDPEILKLQVKLKGVELTIEGGQERSYVEVWNRGAVFNCFKANKVMTVSNLLDFADIIESSGSGFEFDGIRKYMDFHIFETKKTKVVIYLSNDEPLKQIELQLEDCDATMRGVDSSLDLIAKSTNSRLSLQEIKTDSHIRLEATGGSIEAEDLLFAGMDLDLAGCKFALDETNFSALYPIGYSLTMEDASLTVNGLPVLENEYTYAAGAEHALTGKVSGGEVELTFTEG